MQQSDYGNPDWQRAHGVLERLMWLPSDVPEAEIVVRLHHVMGYLFPGIEYPAYAVERQSGSGPMDLRCRQVVFEVKSFRKLEGVNWQGRVGEGIRGPVIALSAGAFCHQHGWWTANVCTGLLRRLAWCHNGQRELEFPRLRP